MAKKKPTAADANQDNGAKPPKKPRAKKVAKPEQFATNAMDYPTLDECPDCKMHQSLCKCSNRQTAKAFKRELEATEPTTETQNTPKALIPTEGNTGNADTTREASSKTDSGQGEATTQSSQPASAEIQGDVPVSVAEAGSFPGAELLESSSRARLNGEKKHNYWERMRKAARLAGLPRGQGPGTAYHWATEQTDREFPPPEPVIVEELPAAETPDEPAMSTIVDIPEEPAIEAAPPAPVADSGVSGLGELPESWGNLPANAQLQVEIAWVSANRLRVRSGNGVDLSRALSPAPSYSALSWLETSILFPSKFADISVKATSQQDDEREGIRREKLAIEEIRGLLAEMLG